MKPVDVLYSGEKLSWFRWGWDLILGDLRRTQLLAGFCICVQHNRCMPLNKEHSAAKKLVHSWQSKKETMTKCRHYCLEGVICMHLYITVVLYFFPPSLFWGVNALCWLCREVGEPCFKAKFFTCTERWPVYVQFCNPVTLGFFCKTLYNYSKILKFLHIFCPCKII